MGLTEQEIREYDAYFSKAFNLDADGTINWDEHVGGKEIGYFYDYSFYGIESSGRYYMRKQENYTYFDSKEDFYESYKKVDEVEKENRRKEEDFAKARKEERFREQERALHEAEELRWKKENSIVNRVRKMFQSRSSAIADKILFKCKETIEVYEIKNGDSTIPSCEEDVIRIIKNELKNRINELCDWEKTGNYERLAHALVCQTSFDLLASGKYHLYAGVLNPMSCAKNMKAVYMSTMDYAVDTNQISEEERKEQIDYLNQCIREVG